MESKPPLLKRNTTRLDELGELVFWCQDDAVEHPLQLKLGIRGWLDIRLQAFRVATGGEAEPTSRFGAESLQHKISQGIQIPNKHKLLLHSSIRQASMANSAVLYQIPTGKGFSAEPTLFRLAIVLVHSDSLTAKNHSVDMAALSTATT